MPWMNKLDPRTRRSAADLGRKVPRRQVSHFPNPERRTSATPLTPLAAKKHAITEGTTRSPEPRWEASLAWSLHHNYLLLAANAASLFAEDQMPPVKKYFFKQPYRLLRSHTRLGKG